MYKAKNNMSLGGKFFEKGKVYNLTNEEFKTLGHKFEKMPEEKIELPASKPSEEPKESTEEKIETKEETKIDEQKKQKAKRR